MISPMSANLDLALCPTEAHHLKKRGLKAHGKVRVLPAAHVSTSVVSQSYFRTRVEIVAFAARVDKGLSANIAIIHDCQPHR